MISSKESFAPAPSKSVIHRPPDTARTSCWVARLSPPCSRIRARSATPAHAPRYFVYMPGLDAAQALPPRPPVPMCQGTHTGPIALPGSESPPSLAPTPSRRSPAAAYGLARCALFGAHASECTPLAYEMSALATVPNEAGYHAPGAVNRGYIYRKCGG